ncbi:hypothetical protein JCM17380_31110 [Desulfosporosinus burensis]
MASILDQLAWDSDTGAITFNGVRYLLIRPETLGLPDWLGSLRP